MLALWFVMASDDSVTNADCSPEADLGICNIDLTGGRRRTVMMAMEIVEEEEKRRRKRCYHVMDRSCQMAQQHFHIIIITHIRCWIE